MFHLFSSLALATLFIKCSLTIYNITYGYPKVNSFYKLFLIFANKKRGRLPS
nr:MAG TPA: hypothetical protein [Caudoviricetes sp.]